MNNLLIDKNEAIIVAIDFQERLLPAMKDSQELEETVVKFIKGARALKVPILVTQQYTKGLGETTAPIKEALGDFTPIEKTTFSAYQTSDFVRALEKTGRQTVILFGIEAHICVQQTALELIEQGYKVFVLRDCCSSRKKLDRKVSYERMTQSGAFLTTYESALYEMLGGAKAEGFKEISAIVK